MEVNRKAHPDCVYASNPFHECASACLEKIAQGQGRQKTKKQASKLFSFSGSFGKRKKESESLQKLHQNGSFKAGSYPAKEPPTPLSYFLQKKLEPEKKYFSTSSSSDEPSGDFFAKANPFDKNRDRFLKPVLLPKSNSLVQSKGAKPTRLKHENGNEKNDEAKVARSLSFLSPPRSWSNEDTSNDDDDIEAEKEEEVEPITSDSCVFIGKYQVQANVSSVLQSILNKHGDIASNCELQSMSMRTRYLECVCSVVQELQSTKFENLTRAKVREMLAVVKDVESVDINVAWLRNVLNELVEAVEAKRQYQEKERYVRLVESTRRELRTHEEELAQKEKEVVDAKARVEETRAQLGELELKVSRLNEIQPKVEKFRGKSYIDELL